jgi:hypothetical protein
MSTQIIKAEDYGLTIKQGSEISSMFSLLDQEKIVIVQEYNSIIQKELTVELSSEGAELDKKMQKHLKAKKEIHTAKKSFFLNGGRFCDSIFNVEKVEFEIMREVTGKIRYFAENIKKEAFAKLQVERITLLSKVMEGAEQLDLASMREDVWDAFLEVKQKAFQVEEERLEKLENERLAKIVADELENKRVLAQNAELLKEREERDRLAKIQESEREAEATIRMVAEIEAQRERDIVSKREREGREKLEKELRLKKDAELLAIENEKIRLQNELSKGDADKVIDLAADLKALSEKYNFESDKNRLMYSEVVSLLNNAIKIVN